MYRAERGSGCYVPAWWIPGAHLRTMWGKLVRVVPRVATRSLRLDTPDGDFLELQRVDAAPRSPRLILLHGLEGSPRSHYARALLAQASRRGWGADLLVFRSCGAEMNRTARFYHSGETGDLDFLVGRLLAEFPHSRIVIAGVSLGGNVLLKWLGEKGDTLSPRVAAAAAISVPYDLARSSRHISRGFSRVYEAFFLRSLRRKAMQIRKRFPDLRFQREIGSISTLWEFDDVVTAPLHGFTDAQDYYARSSSISWLKHIRVPTLLLSARDDPFLPSEILDDVAGIAAANPAITLELVEHGGHVGFIGGRNPFKPFYYAEWRACEFLGGRIAGKAG